jgi:hypothetical protein
MAPSRAVPLICVMPIISASTQSSGRPFSPEACLQVVAEVYPSHGYMLVNEHEGGVLLKRQTTSEAT